MLQDKDGELIKATRLSPGAAHQKWVSPANLTSLLQEVRCAKSSGQSLRLVGGNTGPGVYKDWPVDVDVLIGTTGVPELTNITSRQVHARRLVSSLCFCCSDFETCFMLLSTVILHFCLQNLVQARQACLLMQHSVATSTHVFQASKPSMA